MDTTRFILVLALSMISMMLWQAWETDYGQAINLGPASELVVSETQAPALLEIGSAAQSSSIPKVSSVPFVAEQISQTESSFTKPEKAESIEVTTDLFHLQLNSKGGGIMKAALLKYPEKAGQPETPFVLLEDSKEKLYTTQGGLLSKQEAPTHEAIYSTSSNKYVLQEDQDNLQVKLYWSTKTGITVTKVYELTRGSYLIKIRYLIENRSGEAWQGRSYHQIKRSAPKGGRRLIYTYTGVVVSSPEERYEKIDYDDLLDQKLERDLSNGWVAMLQHYFVTALVPTDKQQAYRYYSNTLANDRYLVGAITPPHTINNAATGTIEEHIYIGPKIIKNLEKVSEGLELTVDYGMLWFIAKPLFGVLNKLHDYTNNWGWAIILVTIILKLLFFPLSAAGYKSMANMRRVQPRMMSIKERYKEDKAKLNQAMMQIYKEEKINPLGGCFPILVQIPVFIALYWVLLESVEMRQAPFALWLQDLSSPDPYFVLPLVMGITMFIQQKLNPAPMDPIQAKVMSVLPIAFTVFFAFFPSGLVLYWVVNNILSIAQQWQITRSLERSWLSSKS
jgi:YidC/Oxa1 family membrane protein insertase